MHSTGRGRARVRIVMGDRPGFESDFARLKAWYSQMRITGFGAQGAFWEASLALLDGRFHEVEGFLTIALQKNPHLREFCVVGRARLAFDRGRLDDAIEEAKDFLDRSPVLMHSSVLPSMLAVMHLERGERGDASRLIREVIADGYGGASATRLAGVAEVLTGLEDAARAADLYAYLLPYSGLVAFPVMGLYCAGAIDRYLGQLAATTRRWDEAERHYQGALILEEGLRAPTQLARTRYWYGRTLLERGRAADIEQAHGLLRSSMSAADEFGMALLADQTAALVA